MNRDICSSGCSEVSTGTTNKNRSPNAFTL